ncbi:MAG: trypsin-like peptidase domain-containing protein [Bacteroidota bacterium]
MTVTRKIFLFQASILTVVLCLFGLAAEWVAVPASAPALPVELDSREEYRIEQQTFQAVLSDWMPAVVQVRLLKHRHFGFGAKYFEDFFLPENLHKQQTSFADDRMVGSGVIFRQDGFIVTARHLVADADEIHVVLHDGTRLPAIVAGVDLRLDLALLQVAATGLPYNRLDNATAVRAGQLAFAIGSPMAPAFKNSVTMGVVSAAPKATQDTTGAFWLTDAALNPGNSGGPLFGSDGVFLGLAQVPFTDDGVETGLKRVLAAPQVSVAVHRMLARSAAGKAQLGIQYEPVAARHRGAVEIIQVEPGSSASEAGLRQGDIILAINGAQLSNEYELTEEMAGRVPGEVITLTIERGKDAISMQIRLKAAPQSRPAALQGSLADDVIWPALGILIDAMSVPLAYDLGIPAEQGVVVLYADPSRKAYQEAGIRSGMVVVELDGQPVATRADFVRIFAQLKPGTFARVKMYRAHSLDPEITAIKR